MRMQGIDIDKKYTLMVVFLLLMITADYVIVGSTISVQSVSLDSGLLCESRCRAKCFSEHNSTNQCQHCNLYSVQWMTENCNNSACQTTCNNLLQNETGSVPSNPTLEMEEGVSEKKLVLSWDTQEPQAIYVLLQRHSQYTPWRLLHQTTDNEYVFEDFFGPPCDEDVTQIGIVAVNQFGQSLRSNVILIGNITAAKNFRNEMSGPAPGNDNTMRFRFEWTNTGWHSVAGRHTVSVTGYSNCDVLFENATSTVEYSYEEYTYIDISKDVVSKNCVVTVKLHNEYSCYSIKEHTINMALDCRNFGSDMCDGRESSDGDNECGEPHVTTRARILPPVVNPNQTALVSWTTKPTCIPDTYHTIVRWEQTGTNLFNITILPVKMTSVLLTDLNQGVTYGVQVAVNKKDANDPDWTKMATVNFHVPTVVYLNSRTDVTTASPHPSVEDQVVTVFPPPMPSSRSTHSYITALVVSGSLVIVVIGVILCICCVKHSVSNGAIAQDEESKPNIYSTIFPLTQQQISHDPSLYDRWEIPFNHIQPGNMLGQGAFGKVIKGTIQGRVLTCPYADSHLVSASMKSRDIEVAVKMLHEYAEDSQKQEFMREIKLMKNIGYHANVVSLIACCTHQDPICLVVEHCSKGDLLNFLRSRRPHYFAGGHSVPAQECLSPSDLLSFARQVVLGMEYLSQKGFVHRDLAARNVLVMEDQTLKIGDFGLTRFVYNDKIYINRHGGRLPIKWMSIESLFDDLFTSKSDVWSFGILLFEIITLGSAPYPGVSNHDIPRSLKRGYIMDQPEGCSDELYAVMKCCWRRFPDERPSFTDLRHHLENILEQDTPYLDLDVISLGVIEEESDSHSSHSEGSLDVKDESKDKEKEEEEEGLHEKEEEQEEELQQTSNHGNHIDETKPMLNGSLKISNIV